jgi:hypothetical protein
MQAVMVLRGGIAWRLWPIRRFCPYKAETELLKKAGAALDAGWNPVFRPKIATMQE